VHGNARMAPLGRLTMVMRIESGRPVAHVAAEMGVSRPTACKWWRRWQADGVAGLVDRPSVARSCPHRTPVEAEAQIVELRQTLKLGPVRIGARLGVPPSTVHRVLCRRKLNRLAWLDRPTGRVIRRIHTDRPGELVHIDVKKLGRIPDGGGWRAHGREAVRAGRERRSRGMACVHSAVDACSRLAYSEIHDDERATTCAAFWLRAHAFFAGLGVTRIDAVMTDNAKNYTGTLFAEALAGIEHRRIRPYRPQTNGKVERFNRTLLEEWAYVRVYRSDAERTAALDDWLHTYNHHRFHTAIGGTPASRVNNPPGQYSQTESARVLTRTGCRPGVLSPSMRCRRCSQLSHVRRLCR
jgi:transposase InsO family protein